MRLNTRTYVTAMMWILVSQISLISCSTSSNVDTQPDIGIDDGYINQQVTMKAPEYFNSFQTYDPLILEVSSHSENEIRFSNDFSLRIFQRTDNGWIEIKEKPMTRLPKDDVIFSPASSMSKNLAVFPDVQDRSQEHDLRIYVIGDMQTEQGIQKISAYIDLQLQP